MSNPLSFVEIIKNNGKNMLRSYQRVIGTCNAETLGYVKANWILEGKALKLTEVTVEKQ